MIAVKLLSIKLTAYIIECSSLDLSLVQLQIICYWPTTKHYCFHTNHYCNLCYITCIVSLHSSNGQLWKQKAWTGEQMLQGWNSLFPLLQMHSIWCFFSCSSDSFLQNLLLSGWGSLQPPIACSTEQFIFLFAKPPTLCSAIY